MYSMKCDVHTHTLFSRHAYSTIEENVRTAAARGLELLGSTDHFSNMLFDEHTIKNFQFFINTVIWPRHWHGVRLLRGCEADIVNLDGDLFGHDIEVSKSITDTPLANVSTLQDLVFRSADYVIASLHDKRIAQGASKREATRMYLKALEHPKVMILGHIGRSWVDLELDVVLRAARDLGKLIEINETSISGFYRDRCLASCTTVADRAAEIGCGISFGSDAHISPEIGRSECVSKLLAEIDFPLDLVSCRSAEAFMICYEKLFGPLVPTGELN